MRCCYVVWGTCSRRARCGSRRRRRRLRVACDEAAAMVDFHELAVLGVHGREQDLAACGRDDRRAGLGGKIDAVMKCMMSGEGVDPVTEIRREPRIDDRQSRWQKLPVR